ncbi:MAG: hypothetical protein ACREV1_09290, partial [Gammaproteobacteria bacterium]
NPSSSIFSMISQIQPATRAHSLSPALPPANRRIGGWIYFLHPFRPRFFVPSQHGSRGLRGEDGTVSSTAEDGYPSERPDGSPAYLYLCA